MRFRVTWAAFAAAAIALACVPAVASAASPSSSPVSPHADRFYSYSGPLANLAPGTILRRRAVSLAAPIGGVVSASQVLYRTTDELGQPSVTVATVIRPPAVVASKRTKILSYQTAYDALGPQCDPSYTLRGGNPGYFDDAETALMGLFVAHGDTVVVPDYEGVNLDWTAGQESGYATLDGVRAAERLLKAAPKSTPVGMVGYSGGSIATQFASELAPRYAPALDVVGAAEGGVPVDLAHNLAYVNGSRNWSGTIPAVLVGTSRAFGIDLYRYASAYGAKIARRVSGECIINFLGAYPGLKVAQLLKPGYKDFLAVPMFATITNDLIMGDAGTPRGPLLMGVGNSDGTGDGVMIAKDVAGLADEYCHQGVSVEFHEYVGDDHTAAAVPFLTAAVSFLTKRLDGRTVHDGCGSIPAGDSLAPLPVPHLEVSILSSAAHALSIRVRLNRGTVLSPVITLTRGTTVVGRAAPARLDTRSRTLVIHHRARFRAGAALTLELSQGGVGLGSAGLDVVKPKR